MLLLSSINQSIISKLKDNIVDSKNERDFNKIRFSSGPAYTCAEAVTSSLSWSVIPLAASVGSLSHGSKRPVPPGSKIPAAIASNTRWRAALGESGRVALEMALSTISSTAYMKTHFY